jgi:hypothetical protein
MRDQLLPPYASSYDGGKYGAYNALAGRLDQLIAALDAPLTDADITAMADRIATALVVSQHNALGDADHAAIVADVKQALREGTV